MTKIHVSMHKITNVILKWLTGHSLNDGLRSKCEPARKFLINSISTTVLVGREPSLMS